MCFPCIGFGKMRFFSVIEKTGSRLKLGENLVTRHMVRGSL